jgi:hypothetical protein
LYALALVLVKIKDLMKDIHMLSYEYTIALAIQSKPRSPCDTCKGNYFSRGSFRNLISTQFGSQIKPFSSLLFTRDDEQNRGWLSLELITYLQPGVPFNCIQVSQSLQALRGRNGFQIVELGMGKA